MFHVKPAFQNLLAPAQWRSALGTAFVFLAVASASPVMAALNKCTSPDGRTTFSDQPCPQGAAAEVLKEAPRSPSTQVPKAGATANGAAIFESVKRRLPPDCAAILVWMQERKGDFDSAKLEARMTPKCETLIGEALERELGNPPAKTGEQADVCGTQRKLLAERRPGLSKMDAETRSAFQKIEQEVARNCR